MGKKLFVGNLPWSLRTPDLEAHLANLGIQCERAEILMDSENPERSRGFGFVHFTTDREAAGAMQILAGSEIGGRELVVEEANSDRAGRRPASRGRPERSRGPRGYRDED